MKCSILGSLLILKCQRPIQYVLIQIFVIQTFPIKSISIQFFQPNLTNQIISIIKEVFIRKNWKQAGAELGQAQYKLKVKVEVGVEVQVKVGAEVEVSVNH